MGWAFILMLMSWKKHGKYRCRSRSLSYTHIFSPFASGISFSFTGFAIRCRNQNGLAQWPSVICTSHFVLHRSVTCSKATYSCPAYLYVFVVGVVRVGRKMGAFQLQLTSSLTPLGTHLRGPGKRDPPRVILLPFSHGNVSQQTALSVTFLSF